MIIDTHVHIWEVPPIAPVGPTAPSFKGRHDEPGRAETLLEEMDEHGIDVSIVVQDSGSTWDNGYVADSAAKWPDRLIAHGLLDPFAPDNAEQARYWMEERGVRGFRFHPMYYDEPSLNRPENWPMWDVLAEHNAVVQVHMRPAQARQLSEVASAWGTIPFILDHMSYPDMSDGPVFSSHRPIFELALHPNMYVKISDTARQSGDEFPYPAIQKVIRRLIDDFGAERSMWGTGYPGRKLRTQHGWLPMDEELRFVREGLDWLSNDERENLLGGTAAKVWGLDERPEHPV